MKSTLTRVLNFTLLTIHHIYDTFSHIFFNFNFIDDYASLVSLPKIQSFDYFLANLYDPRDEASKLHRCDFNDKKEVGMAFSILMEKGSSEPWETIMYEFLGTVTSSTKRSTLDPLWIFWTNFWTRL